MDKHARMIPAAKFVLGVGQLRPEPGQGGAARTRDVLRNDHDLLARVPSTEVALGALQTLLANDLSQVWSSSFRRFWRTGLSRRSAPPEG